MTILRSIVRFSRGCSAVPPRGFNVRWIEHNHESGQCVGVLWCSDNVAVPVADRRTAAELAAEASRLGTVLASHPQNPTVVGRIGGVGSGPFVEEG